MHQLLLALTMYVNGVAFNDDMKDAVCTCTSKSNTKICVVSRIPMAQDGWRMISLLDKNKNPTNGTVDITCMKSVK